MKLSDVEFRAMNTRWRKWGQKHIELPTFQRMGLDILDKDVLEIGCGSGYGAHLLNQLHPKSYVGLDVMEDQIAIARKNFPQYQFLVQDATDLSRCADASFDVVVIFGVMHHIPAWRKVIDEIARVLRMGGSLFIEEPRTHDIRIFDFFFRWGHPNSDFGLKAMETYLQSRGFSVRGKRWTPILTMVHAQKSG